jgi:hypothetical protein
MYHDDADDADDASPPEKVEQGSNNGIPAESYLGSIIKIGTEVKVFLSVVVFYLFFPYVK